MSVTQSMCPHFSKASLGVKSGGGKHNSMMNSECGEKTPKLCVSQAVEEKRCPWWMTSAEVITLMYMYDVVTDCLACCICYPIESMVDMGAI